LIADPCRRECRRQKSFHHFPHALGLRIRHFQIDLRELRLAVGAQVFVAETAHDLKIFIEPEIIRICLKSCGDCGRA
jgi:hypothetical protein